VSDIVRFLEHQRAHGEWSDARLLQAVRGVAGDVSAVLRELSHLRGAQEIWLSRIEQRPPTMPVWPEWNATQLADAGVTLDEQLRTMFASLTAERLEEPLQYQNLAGLTFRTPLGHVLQHLLTHGHYHRGKANAALRDAGIPPVSIDYILWQRDAAAGRA
jgi:uncharacterized damage-inducible protein DinB